MSFVDPAFPVFLGVVLVVYWAARTARQQNGVLLLASYLFYGYWDARFLLLLGVSTVLDFLIGGRLDRTDDERVRKLQRKLEGTRMSYGSERDRRRAQRAKKAVLDMAVKLWPAKYAKLNWRAVNIQELAKTGKRVHER